MYKLYRTITGQARPILDKILQKRIQQGKEDPARVQEKRGITSIARPKGILFWVHAASVGEAQSTLILINHLLQARPDAHFLVTTGTVTSAKIMAQRLPPQAFHQYCPLDFPQWVCAFLDHWQPDLVFWMESELWPNILFQIKHRNIPAVLVNARMSARSYRTWKYFKPLVKEMVNAFSAVFCQTQEDLDRFAAFGATREILQVTDNIKYSSSPLDFDKDALQTLSLRIAGRPLWLYASTHDGEEEMACRVHQIIKNALPDILTIIIPRHPARTEEILAKCAPYKLRISIRGEDKSNLPDAGDDVYLVNTLGELGLFYRLAPLACIGRSFSNDGGGGHNPIEAAQLGCAVLHGANIQNLQEIFDDMDRAHAALRLNSEAALASHVLELLQSQEKLDRLQKAGITFSREKAGVINKVMQSILPLVETVSNRTGQI